MGSFSRSKPAAEPDESCPANCRGRYQERENMLSRTREKARFQQEQGGDTSESRAALSAASRFDRNNEAMVHARAAENVYTPEKPGTCLTNLSNDPAKLNAQLGLPPGTLKPEDFRDDKTGFKASLYQSQSNGKYILAYAGTNPSSLADWKTNIDNGRGIDTEQYKSARALAAKLQDAGVDCDITGHSKGGGLATEAGLVDGAAKVWTFNSAGLNPASLARTGASNFSDLTSRTQAFHTQGDFLTMLQTRKDPADQISGAEYLRSSFEGNWYTPGLLEPLKITQQDNTGAAVNDKDRSSFFGELDRLIGDAKAKQAKGEKFNLFPQAVGQSHETGTSIAGSPGLLALRRHTMPQVISDLEDDKNADQKTMKQFLNEAPAPTAQPKSRGLF